jgi:hypothetical protein
MSVDLEKAVSQEIIKLFTAKAERLAKKLAEDHPELPRRMRRGAHPKHHGIVRALFTVPAGLPPELRHGLFARPRTYPAYVRFSNSGSEWDDRTKDARGMAIKLLDVEGPKLLDDERATHDFVLVDAAVFVARDPEDFLGLMVLLAKITAAKDSGKLEELARLLAELDRRFPNVSRLRRVIRNPLFVPYFSQTAYALGAGLKVKYQARPRRIDNVEPSSTELDARVDPINHLAEAMAATLDAEEVVFDFLIQVGQDGMPVDDPTIEWKEDEAPFVRVATVSIPRQKFTWPAQRAFAENISFNPWHALDAHRPLGPINDVRREVYVAMLKQRHGANGVTPREPTGIDDF